MPLLELKRSTSRYKAIYGHSHMDAIQIHAPPASSNSDCAMHQTAAKHEMVVDVDCILRCHHYHHQHSLDPLTDVFLLQGLI
jgi:hypothetical protein